MPSNPEELAEEDDEAELLGGDDAAEVDFDLLAEEIRLAEEEGREERLALDSMKSFRRMAMYLDSPYDYEADPMGFFDDYESCKYGRWNAEGDYEGEGWMGDESAIDEYYDDDGRGRMMMVGTTATTGGTPAARRGTTQPSGKPLWRRPAEPGSCIAGRTGGAPITMTYASADHWSGSRSGRRLYRSATCTSTAAASSARRRRRAVAVTRSGGQQGPAPRGAGGGGELMRQ